MGRSASLSIRAAMLFPFLALAQPAAVHAADEALSAEVLKQVKEATVFLRVVSNRESAQGSAFFLTSSVLVTNAHVVCMDAPDSPKPRHIQGILFSGDPKREKTYNLQVLAADPTTDLAFLTLNPGEQAFENRPKPLPLASAENVHETLPVYISGFPFGDVLAGNRDNPAVTISQGSVSSLRMNKDDKLELIQISGNLNPGNSGGPIINARGEVIAVSVMAIRGTTVSFAIPCDVVREKQKPQASVLSVTRTEGQNGKHTFRIAASLYNPLGNVLSVQFECLAGSKTSPYGTGERDLLDKTAPAAEPEAKRTTLTRNEATGEWEGTVTGIDLPDGKGLWARFRIQAGGEKFLTAPQDVASLITENKRRGPEDRTPGSQPKRITVPTPHKDTDDPERSATNLQFVSLGANLLQFAGTPGANSFFAIHENEPNIAVFGSDDLKPYSKILAARLPKTLWCDDENLIVHCQESQAFQVFDLRTQKAIRAIPTRDTGKWTVTGRGAGGGYLALLGFSHMEGYQQAYRIDNDDKVRKFSGMRNSVFWMVAANESAYFFTTKDSLGIIRDDEYLILSDSLHGYGLLPKRDRYAGNPIYGNCHVVPGSSVMLVSYFQLSMGQQSAAGTYAIAPSLRRTLFQMPGFLVAAVPEKGYCVLIDQAFSIVAPDNRGFRGFKVVFASLSNGQVFKEITVPVDTDAADKLFGKNQRLLSALKGLYLRKSNTLLVVGSNTMPGDVAKIDCGDVESALPKEPYFFAGNQPPRTAKQGEELSFTPNFSILGATDGFTFQLKQGPMEMRVDRKTGNITWTPSTAYRGFYDVEIIATHGDIEVPVLYWILNVQP